MESILKKTKQNIEKLEETINVQDDKSITYKEESESIFSMFNKQATMNNLKVNVDIQIDEDVHDGNASDSVSEGGEDTVFGQGSNPKPEDETYLGLLKKSSPKVKNVKINTGK